MKAFPKIYVKYIIKSPVIFYAFLAIGVIGFVVMSVSVKLDVTKRYETYFDNNRIIINEELADIDMLYVYKSLNDRVHSFPVSELYHVDDYTIIYVENYDDIIKNSLLGIVKIEIITGQENLLKTIFLRAGNKDEDN